MTRLQYLCADRNQLHDVPELRLLKDLKTFSAREQRVNASQTGRGELSVMADADVHDVMASGNILAPLPLHTDYLNLQNLEIASCGLQTLPDDFGRQISNVRKLNLNFNAIKDLAPLLGIKCLSTLSVAGNRLSRLRKNLAVASRLSTLSTLDLRDNPLTVGFYTPTTETRLVAVGAPAQQREQDERFALPPADADADHEYAARLDEDTKLRRRVYEILLGSGCAALRTLDGLPFDCKAVLAKDDAWHRLVSLGVLRKSRKEDEGFVSGTEGSE